MRTRFRTRRVLLRGRARVAAPGQSVIDRRPTWRETWRAPRVAQPSGPVTVDPAMYTALDQLVARMHGAVVDAFARRLPPMMDAITAKWPVRTGLSRSLLSLRFAPAGPGRFKATIACDAQYARFIHHGQTVELLVNRPAAAVIDLLRNDLKDEMRNG